MNENQVAKLEALHEIGQALTCEYDLDMLLSMIVDEATRLLSSEETILFLADDRNEVLYARAQKTDTSELPRLVSLKTSDSILVNVYRTGASTRLSGGEVQIATGLLGTAMLAVQIGFRGKGLGVLAAYNWSKGHGFKQEDEYFLSAVSSYAAIAIRNSRLMRQKDVLATTDPLTGLYNRRAFDDALHGEVARARRYGTPAGLILLDVDSYKEFNDRFGHQAGDEQLMRLGNILCNQLRESDRAFRIGGDEFAVLVPHVDNSTLSAMGERIHKAILANTPDAPSQGTTCSGYTMSIGAAICSDKNDTAEKLFFRADQALLEAKKMGGNLVFMSAMGRRLLHPFG